MSALWDLGLHSRNILLFSTPNTLLSSTLSPKPSMSSAQCKAHADRLMRRKWHEEETVCMCLYEIIKVPWCWRSEHWERGSPFLMSCRLVRLWKNDSETEWNENHYPCYQVKTVQLFYSKWEILTVYSLCFHCFFIYIFYEFLLAATT